MPTRPHPTRRAAAWDRAVYTCRVLGLAAARRLHGRDEAESDADTDPFPHSRSVCGVRAFRARAAACAFFHGTRQRRGDIGCMQIHTYGLCAASRTRPPCGATPVPPRAPATNQFRRGRAERLVSPPCRLCAQLPNRGIDGSNCRRWGGRKLCLWRVTAGAIGLEIQKLIA
ncbi:hypothetical protein B0H11DRAFT_2011431 [Mycena galericulata]|nr:hypothetical protein B0H11DRAFT_2011431 [Mycena galericulata]